MSQQSKVCNITFEHFLKAVASEYDLSMQDHRGNPLVNLETNMLFNKKEVFRRAYKYANNEPWDKDIIHNKIARECIQDLISGHPEWHLKTHG
ncbi:TPA: hypothetical protein RQK66_004514 [Vibrio vulnificus]|nr:hypothetical protein [Vibrio vulnificus]HDY8159991.1 hypothetical protein [Vibrio vulnificus]